MPKRLPPLVLAVLLACPSVATAQDLALMRLAARCDSSIPWITDGYTAPDLGRPTPITDNPNRGALLDEALMRAGAEKKLVLWYVTRIHGPQMYRSPILDDYLKVVAFTEERVATLIASRFVPLRMAADAALGERTGIKSLDWIEPAFAVLGPDGKILRRFDRIRTFSAERFRSFLIDVLEKNAALAPVPAALVQLAADAMADHSKLPQAAGTAIMAGWTAGAERACEKMLEIGMGAEGRLFLAQNAVDLESAVERSGAFAATAAKMKDHPVFPPLGRFAEGKAALLERRYADAEAHLAAASGPDSPPMLRPTALYRLATAQILQGKTKQAEATFRELCTTFPDTSRAWQAASNLITGRDTTPVGPAFHHFDDDSMPTKAEIAWLASAESTRRPRALAEADQVVKDALEWLLARQDANGQWKDARYAYWDSPRILPNAWTAATAVVCGALEDWRVIAPDRVDAALAKAETALFSPRFMERGQNEEIYADGFRAIYLSKKLARSGLSAADADAARQRLGAIAKEMNRQQNDAGFFGHEYPNPFTTAAALVSLDKARSAGAVTGDAVFTEGAKALQSVRSQKGAFAYGAGRKPGDDDEGLKNSMARGPGCEHALLLGGVGAGETKALSASFDVFEKYLPRLEAVRVNDFHSDGELAGFFFWHAAYFTSEAARMLPQGERAARMAALRDHVLKIGEADGAFIDSHEMGKSYATGMALMTLKNVLAPKPQ